MKIVTIQVEVGVDDNVSDDPKSLADYLNQQFLNQDTCLILGPENIVNVKYYY
jgi:hypothetical protein